MQFEAFVSKLLIRKKKRTASHRFQSNRQLEKETNLEQKERMKLSDEVTELVNTVFKASQLEEKGILYLF